MINIFQTKLYIYSSSFAGEVLWFRNQTKNISQNIHSSNQPADTHTHIDFCTLSFKTYDELIVLRQREREPFSFAEHNQIQSHTLLILAVFNAAHKQFVLIIIPLLLDAFCFH